jgi:CRP-like cAMP-binding protein
MELDDTASILANTEFFRICSPEQMRLLAFASERHRFSEGETIFVAGDSSRGAYVLVAGQVTIADDPDRQAKAHRVTEPGTVIGATALVLPKPRAGTAIAASDVDTLFVPREAFMKLARQNPELASLAAERLRSELTGYLGTITALKDRISVPEGEE